MPFDRVGNTRLTELVPNERRYVNDDPARGPSASGMDIARMGSQTLDRADPLGYAPNRYGLTPPVRGSANSEYGDEMRAPVSLYPV